MGRKLETNYGPEKAALAEELTKARIVDRGRMTITIQMEGEGGTITRHPVDARLFGVEGIGLDEATYFVALDPTSLHQPCYGAGTADLLTFLPGTHRRRTIQEAQLEAVKFVLRYSEEERAAIGTKIRALHAKAEEATDDGR